MKVDNKPFIGDNVCLCRDRLGTDKFGNFPLYSYIFIFIITAHGLNRYTYIDIFMHMYELFG